MVVSFWHTIAGNLTTVFPTAARYGASRGSRIPGLRILGLAVVVPLLTVLATSCSAHYKIHSGALNSMDSTAYDALLIAEITITARTQCGAGLGLSMVYNLVTAALHGTVKAESKLNEGTTITIAFPHVIPD